MNSDVISDPREEYPLGFNSRNKFPQCSPVPYMVYDVDGAPNTLTCAPPGKDETKEGNNVQFQVIDNSLTCLETKFDYCDPALAACDCNHLLGQVLKPENTRDVVRIIGRRPSVIALNVQPDEAGCRCYLSTARNAGFKFVKIGSAKKECIGIEQILEGNRPLYLGVCAKYAQEKCFNDNDLWQIAKNRQDIKDQKDIINC